MKDITEIEIGDTIITNSGDEYQVKGFEERGDGDIRLRMHPHNRWGQTSPNYHRFARGDRFYYIGGRPNDPEHIVKVVKTSSGEGPNSKAVSIGES